MTTKTTSRKAPAKKARARKSAPKKTAGLTEARFKAVALSFPGAEEGTSYGQPAILVNSKFFTRLRREDNSLVLFVDSIDERDMLIEADPSTFHITEHYRNYPTVLARLEKLDAARLQAMLDRRWRRIAPKKVVKERDLKAGTR